MKRFSLYSIDQGGSVATSEITTHDKPVFRQHDVIHYCVPNVASRVAHTATTDLSNIFTPIICAQPKKAEWKK